MSENINVKFCECKKVYVYEIEMERGYGRILYYNVFIESALDDSGHETLMKVRVKSNSTGTDLVLREDDIKILLSAMMKNELLYKKFIEDMIVKNLMK